MGIRNAVNRRPLTAGGVIIAIVAVCAYFLLRTHPPSDEDKMGVWYYDLGSGELFAAAPDALPPIAAPSNAKAPASESLGVRAFVFSCGSCRNPAQRFVAYVERYTPEARAVRTAATSGQTAGSRMPAIDKEAMGIDPTDPHQGLVIAKADPAKPPSQWAWIEKTEYDVADLEDEIKSRCSEGQTLQPCVPRSP